MTHHHPSQEQLLRICSALDVPDDHRRELRENNLKNVKFRDIFMFHDILEKFVLHVFSEWSPENFYFYRDVVILQALFLNEGPGATEEMRSKFAGIYNE
eukprot:jgi/Bigna1/143410/aug1.78_g18118